MKTEATAGVKLHDGWYFTITELAARYNVSETLIRKRIIALTLQPKMALGFKVYKDDPTIFLKRPKGPPKGNQVPGSDQNKRIGSYGELFLLVQKQSEAIKELYQMVVDLQIKTGEGNTLLLNLVNELTGPPKPVPKIGHQASLLDG